MNILERKNWNPACPLSDNSIVRPKFMLSPSSPINLHFFTLQCPSSSGRGGEHHVRTQNGLCPGNSKSPVRLNFPQLGIWCRCFTSEEKILMMRLLQRYYFFFYHKTVHREVESNHDHLNTDNPNRNAFI